MIRAGRWTGAAALAVSAAALAGPARAQEPGPAPGVTESEVRFGQSAALSGAAAALGRGMQAGIRAAFAEVNDGGGIHGRQLALVSLDDGYEPEAALENTRTLLRDEQVFALIGAVGTPTSRAAAPVATAEQVPYVGAFTGAEFLRDTTLTPTAVNVRASYFQETDAMVRRLGQDLGMTRIAVLYQDDSYGIAGLTGVLRALGRRGIELVGRASYQRNTIAVKSALLQLRRSRPDAVIIIGAYRPVGAFVRWAHKIGFDPIMINISFVGGDALAGDLGPEGEGVFVTQVVPFPTNTGLAVVRGFRRALRRAEPQAVPNLVSLEGYIVGRLAAEVLDAAGRELTRAGFLAALATLQRVDLGGFRLSYGPEDTQGSDRVFWTRINADGRLVPVSGLR